MSRNPVVRKLNIWSRRLHRLGAILFALPMVVVFTSGILLQLKKQFAAIQPPTLRGTGSSPTISLDAILAAARTVPHAQIDEWSDIARLDIQPSRNLAKAIGESSWEVQVDLGTGAVLQAAYRRSDLIESFHDGSFFGEWAKLGLFLPSGIVLLGLWLTGVYLWLLPVIARKLRDNRRAAPNRVPPR